MPIVASAEFARQVESVEYVRAASLTIYPPASAYLDFTSALSSFTLTAAMSTPLPDNAVIQAGTEATTLDVVLAGSFDLTDETMDAADFFNPDNPASPLYHLEIRGCRVEFDWGAYVPGSATPEMPGQLIGWINGADFDWDARTVTLHVVDLDPDWGTTPNTDAVVTAAPYNAGLTTEYAMDALIRKVKGSSTWPAQRPNCVLAVGMRSSVWPEVGTLDTTVDSPAPTFAPGPWGTGLIALAGSGLNYITSGPVGNDFYAELLVSGVGGPNAVTLGVNPPIGNPEGFTVVISNTGIRVYWTDSSASLAFDQTWTVAVDATPHVVGIAFHMPVGSTSVSLTISLDGATHSIGPTAASSARSVSYAAASFVSDGTAVPAGLQVTTETAPVSSYPFTPIAVLDPSLNTLTVVPAIAAGTTAWAEMQTMAAAECGYVRRMPDGTIRFTNRINLLNQPVARTISSDSSLLTGLSTSLQPAAANHAVNVTYTEWTFSPAGLVWAAPGHRKIAANQVTTWTVTMPDGTLVAEVDGTASVLANNATPGAGGNSSYRISLDANGVNPHPGVRSVTIKQLSSSVVQITVDNRGGPGGYLVTPATYTDFDAGTPAMWVGGVLASASDQATVTVSSGDGSNQLDFDSNNYLQDPDSAYAVGLFVLRQVRWDVREFGDVPILPDPRILCGDLDKLEEDDRSQVNDYVMVWGTTFTGSFPPAGSDSPGTWEQTLTARALGPPDSWLGGQIPDRAEAGTSWAY